jgi:high-affinity Fe2+/Pb2+ permease
VEIVADLIGGRERWRTAPKTVLFFGVVAGAMVFFGLLLAAVQAFWLRAGCTLCLASAGISVGIAGLAWEEVHRSLTEIQAGR